MENLHKPRALAAPGAPGSGTSWISKGSPGSCLLLMAHLHFMGGLPCLAEAKLGFSEAQLGTFWQRRKCWGGRGGSGPSCEFSDPGPAFWGHNSLALSPHFPFLTHQNAEEPLPTQGCGTPIPPIPIIFHLYPSPGAAGIAPSRPIRCF